MGRNLILFIPMVLFLPRLFGASALWWVLACYDIPIMIYGGIAYLRHGQQLKLGEISIA